MKYFRATTSSDTTFDDSGNGYAASNWSSDHDGLVGCSAPSSGDDVTILTGVTALVTASTNINFASVTLETGAILTTGSSAYWSTGDVVNAGTVAGNLRRWRAPIGRWNLDSGNLHRMRG